jgi:menaquinone-dependent protoporphyrinogen IX oxidase
LSEEQYRRSTNKNVEDYRFSEKELQYLLGHSLGASIKAQHYDRVTPEFIDSMRDKLNRIPYGFDLERLKEKYQEINIPHDLRDGIARRLKGEF